ncbi:MAG: hypothetical protein JWM68_5675 [Verrucomicrobiales bacterium]|nr:hypothetical protein [Verrucomicrobiales bacterium]
MQNPIDKTNNGALTSMALAINGAILYPTMTLLRYPLIALLALRAAALTARDNYENAKPPLKVLRDAIEVARLEARVFMFLTREILRPTFGFGYSELWNAIGLFVSLEIPQRVDDLILVLEAVVAYLTANPAAGAAHNLTAASAQAVLDTLSDARKAVSDQEDAMANLLVVREDKFTALRKGLRGLLNELSDILGPLDPRWKAFGFNMPGAEETPDAVTGVIAVLIGPTAAAVKWPAVARGGYYHVYQRVQGVDAEHVLIGSPADLDFTIENLPANKSIDIVVAAVNNGGEGPHSEAVTIITH